MDPDGSISKECALAKIQSATDSGHAGVHRGNAGGLFMNTSLLRYAVTYAACGSAQKAAERLGVSRSSVTRNIKRLEEELGAPLFIAAPNGVVPTYTGDICLRYAREILMWRRISPSIWRKTASIKAP